MTSNYSIDELLTESAWVRSLARSLTRSADEADDLVQDVWTVAIRRPPTADKPARPWLATVLRNLARNRGRAASIRRGPRQEDTAVSAALTSAQPSAPELLAELELQEHLSSMVRSLHEPEREAVVLRYHEGLSGPEIAARTGASEGTVRSRIKRGLDRLRSRLDNEANGDRSAWMSALAPLAVKGEGLGRLAAHGAASGAATSGLAAKVLALLIVAAAAVSGWLSLEGLPSPAERVAEAIDPGAPEEFAQAVPRLALDADAAEVRSIDAEEGLAARAAIDVPPQPVEEVRVGSVQSAAAGRVTEVRLRVLRSSGDPVRGATMEVLPNGEVLSAIRSELKSMNLFERMAAKASLKAKTDASGRAVLSSRLLKINTDLQLVVEGPRFGKKRLDFSVEPGALVDLGEMTLDPGARVCGQLVDLDGRSISGSVQAVPAETQATSRESQVVDSNFTAKDGRYEINLEQGGAYVLRAKAIFADDWVYGEPFEATLGEERKIRLSVPRPDTELQISVVAPDGTPTRSHLSYRTYRDGQLAQSGSLGTNAEGQWTFQGPLASIERIELESHSLEGRFFAGEVVLSPPFEDETLNLREVPSRMVRLRFESPASMERLEWTLLALGVYRRGEGEGTELDLRLPAGLEPADELVIRAKGHVELKLDAATLGTLGADSTHRLLPLAAISGTVLASGEPVRHARLRISAKTEPGEWSRVAGGLEGVRWESGHDGTTAGNSGQFSYPLRWPGDWIMEVSAVGFAPSLVELLDFDPAVGKPNLIVELEPSGRVEGRVLDATGAPSPGARVVASHPLHRSKVARANASGEYSVELPPGPWTIVCPRKKSKLNDWSNRIELDPDWSLPADLTVIAGAQHRFDVRLPRTTACKIQVRFEGAEARPVSDAFVSVSAESGDPLLVATSGTFELDSNGTASVWMSVDFPMEIKLSGEGLGQTYRRRWEPGMEDLEWVIPVPPVATAEPSTIGGARRARPAK